MTYDFDTKIDRRAWNSIKWNRYRHRDVIPLWVADMDFPTPEFLLEAIQNRLQAHPVLGYSSTPDELVETFLDWTDRMFNWQIKADWLVWIPSVMTGINIAVRVVGNRGGQCVIPVPVYPPFLTVPEQQDRVPVFSPLVRQQDRWEMDFSNLQLTTLNADTILFCNPQNPTGRVYDRQELTELATVCARNGTILISDDIHWGLVLDEHVSYTPIASLDPEVAMQTITLYSHTKTYNIAGESVAVAIIPDPGIRQAFKSHATRIHPSLSPLALAGATAAFGDQTSWLVELNTYLRQNRNLLQKAINDSQVLSTTLVEGTHLMWIDATQLPVSNPQKHFENFGLGLSDGVEFRGPGFVRHNFAIPRALLETSIERLSEATKPYR